mmetsp:Transcript_8034/g.16603  ORF Transcript_8034/g.16603 Transcript_8034/m.16603 type:complete len:192 (+) Transcript_8034:165-740(+)|eukprot:CAMPEP_0201120540 /NCGR_PEP_ID=MMETSP0850-20130426/4598_1 /ASSEMBLY_ACC=CAM_ASM_000622 /TAXON_ID=183588 /ORGANISM="Pseudo-nitzschia fraudulenta, Strain WWA7" /LENGTH=191 /DNA_ID=CAMNT_0047386725 /DNA_START=170 /DNA_END=745 /DNA_ORIENTATION=+
MTATLTTKEEKRPLHLFLSAALLASSLLVVGAADVDPGADFGGYMEEIERLEQDERMYEEKLRAHEEWRNTTISGWCVKQVMAFSRHLAPFFVLVRDALRDTSGGGTYSSANQVLAYLGVRMVFVLGLMSVVYAGSRVVQLLLGQDFEVVQEVVIVHEHETEEDAARARAGAEGTDASTKRKTRGKKEKAS